MKLRIIKEEKQYIPQYWNEESKWGGWQECRKDNSLVARYYYTLEDAMKVIEKFKELHPKPEVVWEEEY